MRSYLNSFSTTFIVNTKEKIGAYERIFVLIFENTDRADALADPNFASLLPRGLLLDNFYATTHPSQPNYIALVAGDLLGTSTVTTSFVLI